MRFRIYIEFSSKWAQPHFCSSTSLKMVFDHREGLLFENEEISQNQLPLSLWKVTLWRIGLHPPAKGLMIAGSKATRVCQVSPQI